MASSLTPFERETVITMNDGEDTAHIYTHQATKITALKKNPEARLIDEGVYGITKWAQFELPAWAVSFRKARRTGRQTDMASVRAARKIPA